MKSQVFRQLESVRNIKKEQISNFFDERMADISAFSENPTVIEAYEELKAVFNQGSGTYKGYSQEKFMAPQSYIRVHDRYFRFFRNLTSLYGYYDLFLLDPLFGDTFFTVGTQHAAHDPVCRDQRTGRLPVGQQLFYHAAPVVVNTHSQDVPCARGLLNSLSIPVEELTRIMNLEWFHQKCDILGFQFVQKLGRAKA